MDVIIQSLGFKASEQLDSFIKEKLSKLDHLSHKIVRADVTMFIGSDGNQDNKICEIRLEVPGNDHFVKKGAPEFEPAVVACVDALQNVLRKAKEKELDRRQAG